LGFGDTLPATTVWERIAIASAFRYKGSEAIKEGNGWQ
jgi:hypothetical protein